MAPHYLDTWTPGFLHARWLLCHKALFEGFQKSMSDAIVPRIVGTHVQALWEQPDHMDISNLASFLTVWKNLISGKKNWWSENYWKLLKITDNLMSSLSDDLIVWKNLISEILRNSQTFQIIRKPEHQIVSYSQSFRRPAGLKNKPSDILRNFQIFSVFFRHSQIIRSSDH